MTASDRREHPYYTADGEWTFDIHYIGSEPGYTFSPESVRQVLSQVEVFIRAQQEKALDRDGVPPTSCVLRIRVEMSRTPTSKG